MPSVVSLHPNVAQDVRMNGTVEGKLIMMKVPQKSTLLSVYGYCPLFIDFLTLTNQKVY